MKENESWIHRDLFDQWKPSFSFRTYHWWLRKIKDNPLCDGVRGLGLVLAAIPVTMISLILGIAFLPSGRYSRKFLIWLGLIPGLSFVYLYGLIIHRLPGHTSFIVSMIITVIGLAVLGFLFTLIWN